MTGACGNYCHKAGPAIKREKPARVGAGFKILRAAVTVGKREPAGWREKRLAEYRQREC